MSREIKFRGWNNITKTMLDLKAITPLTIDDKLKCDGLFLPFVDEVILMQHTGLKDKDGVEIYEGDVDESGGIVVWNEDDASFYLDIKNIETQSLECAEEWMKVIGNIHQHPELLEK